MDELPDHDTTLLTENIWRYFGDGGNRQPVLRGVSLQFRKGEFALLMGPSGSGKSTLLAILSGLLRPDEGRVLMRDNEKTVNLWNLSASARESLRLRQCGFIFQGYNLFNALTARQQLEIVLRWGEGCSGRQATRRSEEMLKTLGLGHRLHSLPRQLSGGEKQRVAIGRALVKNPQFCFADEPTAALDWRHGEQVVELLRTAAHERGATVLVVSHDPRLIPFADSVHHLADGALTQELATSH